MRGEVGDGGQPRAVQGLFCLVIETGLGARVRWE